MFIAMLVFMFLFDWRMGAACLLAAVVSVAAMATMMGGKNAGLMAEYQAAQDMMSKAGTEYVRGIPVVKVFQQTVYSFKAFKQAIEDYSAKAEHYQADVCKVPQSVNLTFTEGAFVFLVPVALLLAPAALSSGSFAGFVTNFAFYAVFSAIISTALAKIMFAASGMMLAKTALGRIGEVKGKTSGFAGAVGKAGADFKRQFTVKSYRQFFLDAGYPDVKVFLADGRIPCAVAVMRKTDKRYPESDGPLRRGVPFPSEYKGGKLLRTKTLDGNNCSDFHVSRGDM